MQFCDDVKLSFKGQLFYLDGCLKYGCSCPLMPTGPGSAAYDHRKAAMYKGLEEECKQAYTNTHRIAGHLSD